jgi:hypothetical protein
MVQEFTSTLGAGNMRPFGKQVEEAKKNIGAAIMLSLGAFLLGAVALLMAVLS